MYRKEPAKKRSERSEDDERNNEKKLLRVGTGFLAGLMFFSTISSAALTAKAAEPNEVQVSDQYDAMTEEELQAYFSDYLEKYNANPDDVDGHPAAAILAYLGTKVLDKIMDKAMDSAWDSVFGKDPSTQELMDKLNEINGKLDQIMKMLNYILEMMQKQEIKDSITQKNRYFNAIHAEAQTVESRFESSKGKDNYKDLRWAALQKWYSLRLEGTSDAMSGLRFYCNMITDKNNTNWHGSYFSQYFEYAKLTWSWDTQRAAFADAQRDREFFTVAQMATYNLIYLQYAQDCGVQGINFDNERLEIGNMLKEVMDSYDKAPSEHLTPNIMTFTADGKSFQVLYKNIPAAHLNDEDVLRWLNRGQECWTIERVISDKLDAHKPKDTHIMTSAEMDMLLKTAQKENISFDTFMKNGSGKEITKGFTFLLSTNKNKTQVWHYGDREGWGKRKAYLEHYISDGGNTDNHGKHAITVSVSRKDRFENISFEKASDWSPFVYRDGDYWNEFNPILNSGDTRILYVKNSDVMDYPETEDSDAQKEAEGTISELDVQDGRGTFTLTTTDRQELIVEVNTVEEYTALEGLLEGGANVTVEYQTNSEDELTLVIQAIRIIVNNSQDKGGESE